MNTKIAVGICANFIANITYASMRARDNGSSWKHVAFISGLPGTLISQAHIKPGSYKIFGLDIK